MAIIVHLFVWGMDVCMCVYVCMYVGLSFGPRVNILGKLTYGLSFGPRANILGKLTYGLSFGPRADIPSPMCVCDIPSPMGFWVFLFLNMGKHAYPWSARQQHRKRRLLCVTSWPGRRRRCKILQPGVMPFPGCPSDPVHSVLACFVLCYIGASSCCECFSWALSVS